MPRRRAIVQTLLAGGALGAAGATVGCASVVPVPTSAKVVVVGGGFGGATAARYLRMLSGNTIDVVLIEPTRNFVSCPLSNLVIGGARQMQGITLSYDGLRQRHGVTVLHDSAAAIDPAARTIRLAGGAGIRYDKLVLSPGVDLMFDSIPGLRQANAAGEILQAWKAGAETVALRAQLQAIRDGGVFAITVPEAPYRCPPGPYERASLVAAWLHLHKPRSKVLVLDANPEITSKGPLFRKAWSELYPGMVEYRPQQKLVAVDGSRRTLRLELQDDVQADVLNVLPPMRAAPLAVQTGLANANGRWCQVDFRSFESTAARHIHVLGDAVLAAPFMPKSAHMANNHAKVAAAAIVAELLSLEANPRPMLANTCYSYVSPTEAIHVASVHEYIAADGTFRTVAGAGGVSAARSGLEATYASDWARNIWRDSLG